MHATRLSRWAADESLVWVEDPDEYREKYSDIIGSSMWIDVSEEYGHKFLEYSTRLSNRIHRDLSREKVILLKNTGSVSGSRYLLKAAELHQAEGLGNLTWFSHLEGEGLETAVLHLAWARNTEPSSKSERKELVEELKKANPSTLKYLLPHAIYSQRLICDALEWEDMFPLVEEIMRESNVNENCFLPWWEQEIPSVTGGFPTGILNVPKVRSILNNVEEGMITEVLQLFRDAKYWADGADEVITLIESVAGWNRKWIEEEILKGNLLAVEAYGLLPLENRQEELLERYVFLKEFDGASSRCQWYRRFARRKAVKAGLMNLAQAARYSDATRLEWDMQVRLVQDTPMLGRRWKVGDCDIELTMDGGPPTLVIHRRDRELKNLPKDVKKSKAYPEIRSTFDLLKEHASVISGTLEHCMAVGEPVSRKDLENLLEMPVARFILSRLVLRTEDGEFGLLDAEQLCLRDLDGRSLSLTEEFTIAHCHDLYKAGKLSDWQKEIAEGELVQPFKQVFRDIFLLTPDEEELGFYINRFAGHIQESGKAYSILYSRGWLNRFDPVKLFPNEGMTATFGFTNWGYSQDSKATVTSNRIFFQRIPKGPGDWNAPDKGMIPLKEIDPIIFSEVMRDADAAVTGARMRQQRSTVEESLEKRGEIVAGLIENLSPSKLTIDGNLAHVDGVHRKYIINLDSGEVVMDDGRDLELHPVESGGEHPEVFLPIAQVSDPMVGAIVSKAIMLASDGQMEDKYRMGFYILARIKRFR
jgi:hypothetical protein